MPMATDYYKDGELSELNNIYLSTTKWATFLTYPLALLFIFNSKAVVATFFGDQYLPAASALSILSLGMFLRVVVGPNGATIKAINRTKVDLLASIAGVLSNIVLNFILIPRLGFSGAAVATAVSYLIFNVVDSTVVYLSTGIHPVSVSTFKQLLPSGIAAWYLSTMNFSFVGIYRIALLGLILLFIHLVSYIITGSIDSNDDILIDIIEDNLGVDLSILRSG
jgi:O-antigen/teichoic acid export membrane protein